MLQIDNIDALGTSDTRINAGGALRSTVTGDLENIVRFLGAGTSTLSATAGTTLTLLGFTQFGSGNTASSAPLDTGTIVVGRLAIR